MITAFLFDYGGVISSGGTVTEGGPPERLAALLGIDVQMAADLIVPLWDTYSAGTMSEEDMWTDISKRYGQAIGPENWDVWNHAADMAPLPEMVTLVDELRSAGHTIGLLSNVIPNTEKEIRAAGWYDLFDFTVLSNEVGLHKPDVKIYQLAMQHMPDIHPEEVVYLDDQARCLVPAHELGMQTILVQTATQAIADVHALLA